MKVTKRQLTRIVKEEKQRIKDLQEVRKELKLAHAEYILREYPNTLLSKGIISEETYTIVKKSNLLREAGYKNQALDEGFLDSVSDMAGWALEKGVKGAKGIAKAGGEIASAANDKYNTEKNRDKLKDMGMAGAKAIWNAGKGIATYLGKQALSVGQKAAKAAWNNREAMINGVADVGLKVFKTGVGVTASAGKFAGETIYDAIVGGADLRELATENPKGYMEMYDELRATIEGMGDAVPTDPDEAASILGVWATPEGKESLAAGAAETGMSEAQIEALVQLYVLQSDYVSVAQKAATNESKKVTKSELKRIIREEKLKVTRQNRRRKK